MILRCRCLVRHTAWVLTFAVLGSLCPFGVRGWGFLAHKEINKEAVFLLPIELLLFYKKHLAYIREEAVKPDKRRYVVEGEARCHYINLELYKTQGTLPYSWHEAVQRYDAASLDAWGILPWHIVHMKARLTRAFKEKDMARILRLSADLGHYAADACVPLHTTENYDGQLSDQHGIHALWESRLPAFFIDKYDFFFQEKATYIEDVRQAAWEAVLDAHEKVGKVLTVEKALDAAFRSAEKYCFEIRGTTVVRTYTRAYATAYHEALGGMVEEQMRASIHMVASLWLTCWIDAGCPDLSDLGDGDDAEDFEEEASEAFWMPHVRPHACTEEVSC